MSLPPRSWQKRRPRPVLDAARRTRFPLSTLRWNRLLSKAAEMPCDAAKVPHAGILGKDNKPGARA